MNWTKEQEKAIYNKGMNIIVSAGAGSGKTAVLTERVIQKLLNGTHINNLLLLTFTNNAASEMKIRIKNKILKYPEIIEESKMVESADITTFDAFVLSLVKKYHYYLNLSDDLFIIDSSIINKKKKDILDTIFNNYYAQNNQSFINLINSFCTKNDKPIKKIILELDKKIDLISKKEEFLNNYIENCYNEINVEYLLKEYENNLKYKINAIKDLLNDLSFEVTSDYYDKISNSLSPLFNINLYDEIRNIIAEIKLPRLMNSSDKAKYYKEKITKSINDIKSYTVYSKNVLINNLYKTKDEATIIIDILMELTKKIIEDFL